MPELALKIATSSPMAKAAPKCLVLLLSHEPDLLRNNLEDTERQYAA